MTKKQANPNRLQVEAQPGDEDNAMAAALMRPELRAAVVQPVAQKHTMSNETTLEGRFKALKDITKAVCRGDSSYVERVLVSQIATLDAVFNSLLNRGMNATRLEQLKADMGLALKAQRQCALTASALAELKNPAIFVGKQQINQSNGPMQVNNGTPTPAPVKSDQHNELKEITHEPIERLDPGAPGKTSGTDPAMETLGAEHRTQDRGRQGQKRRQSQG